MNESDASPVEQAVPTGGKPQQAGRSPLSQLERQQRRGQHAARKAVAALVAGLTRALGPPVATPATESYRIFRWACPACRGGYDDAGHQLGPVVIRYAPLVVDSDGRVWCEDAACSQDDLAGVLLDLVGSAP